MSARKRPIDPPEDGPRRVLRLIARLNVGGPAKHAAWLMRGLDPARFEQTLAAGPVPAGEDDMGPWLREQGVDYLIIPSLGRAVNPVADLRGLFHILGLLAKTRPHILATHTSKAGFLGRTALLLYRPYARLRGRPVPQAVHTFHGHTFHGYFGPLTGRLFLGLERFLARWATWRIVVISPRQLEEIHQTFGVGRREQFVLTPLGIDLAPFADPGPGRKAFRAELGAGENDILVGAVGRVAPVKNYGLFVEVAARLKQSRPELYARCRFLLIGGGPAEEMAALRERAQALGVAQRVVFMGSRPDPEAFSPGLDALLLTSVNEGTPVAILEGGACGLPVTATEVGGTPDLLGQAEETDPRGFTLRGRGITAPSGDAPALAAGLAHLLDHPDLAARLGGALREYVHARHDKARLVRDIAALYEQADRQ